MQHPFVAAFLQRPACSTFPQFANGNRVDLAIYLGWTKPDKIQKKAEPWVMVEGIAVSGYFLEPEQSKISYVKLPWLVENLSFELYMQVGREKG